RNSMSAHVAPTNSRAQIATIASPAPLAELQSLNSLRLLQRRPRVTNGTRGPWERLGSLRQLCQSEATTVYASRLQRGRRMSQPAGRRDAARALISGTDICIKMITETRN